MKDDFLSNLQEPPRPEFADALYRRINQPMKIAAVSRRRFALGTSLVVLTLFLSLWFSPTIRVYAQNLFEQIGHLFVSHEPTYAEQFELQLNSGTPTAVPAASAEAIEWQVPPILSLAEATELAGFQAVEVKDAPRGLTLVARYVTLPDQENRFTQITTAYSSEQRKLVFSQTVYQPGADTQKLPAGEAIITPLNIQGQDGLWIEHLRLSTYVDENNKVAQQYANLLMWEKDGCEYWLQSSPGLSQTEMLALSDSITP